MHFSFRSTLADQNNPELLADRKELASLKEQKAFLGLSEYIDWVLGTLENSENDFSTASDFLAYLVKDRLYTEQYLHLWGR